MAIPQIQTDPFAVGELPGKAGQAQQQDSRAPLIEELGSNYGAYHAWVDDQLRGMGGIPDPARYTDKAAFMRDYAEAQRLARIEYLLRVCRQARRTGRPVDPHYRSSRPLVADGRIVQDD